MTKYFMDCVFYIALIGIVGFLLGRLLPKGWFRYDQFPFRPFPFEKNGEIYAAWGIRRWKDQFPDMSEILPNLMPSKKLPRRASGEQLMLMVQETYIAEAIHVLLCIAGLHCMQLWPGIGGLAAAVLNVLGNLPYIVIQRFNRPRLVRLLAAHSKRTIMRCEDYACADTQL